VGTSCGWIDVVYVIAVELICARRDCGSFGLIPGVGVLERGGVDGNGVFHRIRAGKSSGHSGHRRVS